MKVLKYTAEQATIFAQLADMALKGCGLQADPMVQQLKSLLATAQDLDSDKPNAQ